MVEIPDETLSVDDDVLDGDATRLEIMTSRVSRPFAALRAVPNLPTFVGLGLVVLGLLLLLVAWGRTAGLHNVALQLPYVLSAGFTGLALVAVGLIVVSVGAKAADAAARKAQFAELQQLLAAVREAVEEGRR